MFALSLRKLSNSMNINKHGGGGCQGKGDERLKRRSTTIRNKTELPESNISSRTFIFKVAKIQSLIRKATHISVK